ncbi:MAG: ion transporter [Kiritimatiellia bacterium]
MANNVEGCAAKNIAKSGVLPNAPLRGYALMKRTIFEIIQPDRGTSRVSRFFDAFITMLILGSVISVYVATLALPPVWQRAITIFDYGVSLLFTVEYLLRVWTADCLYPRSSRLMSRVRYVCSSLAIIDLLAILPFWLPMFVPGAMFGMRALRLVRFLRILKLNRYFDAIKSIGNVVRAKRRELIGSVILVLLLMLVSSLLIYTVEHDAQPAVFKNAFSGLWWAVVTLTTVGYGDIYPVTMAGRIIGAFIALLGVAAVAVPSGIIASGLMEQIGHEGLAAEAEARAKSDGRHESELALRREKDIEHDALLREQGEMLKALIAQISEMRSEMKTTKRE